MDNFAVHYKVLNGYVVPNKGEPGLVANEVERTMIVQADCAQSAEHIVRDKYPGCSILTTHIAR